MNFSYDEYAAMTNKAASGSNFVKIGWFKLAPGQEAIVRFDVSSLEDLQFSTVHTLHTKDGHWMRINCLNPLGQYGDGCPLCTAAAEGTSDISKASKKVYVKLLVSYKDPVTGTFTTPAPVIWERAAGFSKEIASYLKDYGDLTQTLLKVSRQGAGMDTRYIITYAVPTVFKPELVPADFSAFDAFKLEKHSYWEKTKAEIEAYLIDGVFPEVAKVQEPTETVTEVTPVEVQPVEAKEPAKSADKDFGGFSF